MAQKPNKNCKTGDVVRIVFEDHSEGEQHIEFSVYGIVIKKDRRAILVGTFVYYPDFSDIDENAVVYTILRKTIKSIDILVPLLPPTEIFVANV